MTVPNRYESSTLQALAAALSSGLNPQQGLSIWNSLQSEYDQRAQQQQQAAQAQMDSLRKLAVQDASAGMSQDNTRLQMQALYPNLGPNQSMGLDNTLTTLYPGTTNPMGMSPGDLQSPLAPPPPPPPANPNAPPPFTAQSVDAIGKATMGVIQALAKQNPQGTPPDLATVRQQVAAQAYGEYQMYQPNVDAVIEQVYRSLVPNDPSGGDAFGIQNFGTQMALQTASLPNRFGL